MKKKRLKNIIPIIVITAIIALIIAGICIYKVNTNKSNLTPLLSRLQSYELVQDGDEEVHEGTDGTGALIPAVTFDAFFLEDTNGDGDAESVRGTCREIGTDANFYMELRVIEQGTLKDAKITINSNNFYLNTSIVKDNVIKENYISSNTKEIAFNELGNGAQAFLTASVRSGDYTNASRRTAAIGNDTSKYSKENSVTFSGTYVDSNNVEHKFSKTVNFMVDWYGEVNANITPQAQTVTTEDFNNLVSDEGLTLNFDIKVTETNNQLNMYGSYISGTIPELNGYKPTSVKISGTNVTFNYNEETGEFTAQREAVVNSSGIITSNAYTSSSSSTKTNTFNFTIVYPLEAYQAMGEDISSMEIAIPLQAVNKGFNNPNTEDGFENPFTSNTATGIVTTTWKKRVPVAQVYNPYFRIYVGEYMGSPFNTYAVSKEKPINIYNGISQEETDDTYIVRWMAYTGTDGITNGIIMNEQEGKTDEFLNTSAQYISMDDLTTNRGIYFSGMSSTLGQNGWIKVYNADTDELIETFTSSNWNSYSSSNPYLYENKVKHIRVETSKTNELSSFYVYNVKELDDEYITENYTRADFDNLTYIYSYLDGYMLEYDETGEGSTGNTGGTSGGTEPTYWYKDSEYARALYAAPTSVAKIEISEDTLSTRATAENEIITIKTETTGYNEQKWKNGTFLVKLPEDIIYAEINNVTTNNANVSILAYDLYEENGNYFIKILTSNENEETFNISIDCDLTPDPRIPQKTESIELYAINETACDYYYSASDQYDIDGDKNTAEEVNHDTVSITLNPGTSLNTTQMGSDYGDNGNITLAPRVVKTDKNQRTAKITLYALNNYDFNIKEVAIQGVIPFEGNDYVLTGRDLGSTFTTHISEGGIKVTSPELEGHVTIYYSSAENPSNDINDVANGWTLAENVEDWSSIKTYIIKLDDNYELSTGQTIEFEYEISLPEGVDYNEVTYSEHAIYFTLEAEEGDYSTSTGCEKLGFMIAKQYDLEVVKYQEDTEKVLQGVTFSLTEDGQDTSTIKVTDENGIAKFIGLFAERYYTLKEEKTTEDYVLNGEEIRFYTYTEINADGTESLYLQYVDGDTRTRDGTIYDSVVEDTVMAPNEEENEDYKIQIKIEDEVKAKLKIHKVDQATQTPMKNIKFTLNGEGKNNVILTTDANGDINVSGLFLDQEYTLTETKATDYYLPQEPIKFKLTNNNGTIEFAEYTDNGTTSSNTIAINDEIPTIELNLRNEKIPSYGLQLTKYAKGEKEQNEEGEQVDKVLERAQYKIYGEGINADGEIYTTDENGVLTIDGLYEYVEGKYITGEYTLVEIYAPEGYSLNSTELKFKAYRENGTLKIQILEGGEDVIRVIETKDEEGNVTDSKQDLTIADESGTYPTIQIGVEDGQIFSLYKYTTNGTSEKIAIPGAKFTITDLDGNPVTGSDGETIGTWDDTLQKYVVTTDENGQIVANVKEGLYKAVEVYVDDKYVLSENEEDRTYYFGIGASQAATFDWANAVNGQGWDYINSVEATADGGVIGVGEFTEYSSLVVAGSEDGIDLNNDGTIEQVSQGSSDGLISYYDVDGRYVWSKTFGGDNDDALNKVIQTEDGGYAAVGYVTSSTVNYDGKEIPELSKTDATTLANKDAVLLRLDNNGNYQWGIRFGGVSDEEINSVTETSQRQLVVVGNFYSSTMNFYEYGNTNIVDSFDNLNSGTGNMYQSGMNGFVVAYTDAGKYDWSQRIGGTYDIEVTDVINTANGIAIATNHISTVNLDTNNSVTQAGASTSYTNGTIVEYTLDGTYSWRYRIYPSSSSNNVAIASIDTDKNNNIIVALEYESSTIYGSKNGATSGTNRPTIISEGPTNSTYDTSLIRLTNSGDFDKVLYTFKGNYDDYISDAVATSDDGYLIGGWYYSTNNIDSDNDGVTNGENDFPGVTGQYTSDGFIMKLDENGQVQYSSRLYGEGYEGVTSVAVTRNGTLASGGYFNSSTLSATNFKFQTDGDEEEETTSEVILNGNGNSNGFVISEGADANAVVPEAQNLEIENKIKTFKITTEVIKHDESGTQVAGGDIDGEEGTYGGVNYSKDGIRYVETVNYGEDSTKEIQIRPDAGYTISYIKINNVEYTDFTTDENGYVTLPIFEDVLEDKHIIVEFSNTKSLIEVNYYLWTPEAGPTTEKVSDSESYVGDVGEEYKTAPKTDIEYEIVTNADFYGEENVPEGLNPDDYYIPDNSTGTYKEGEKEVINYYYKEKTYTLTVHHYIAGTNDSVPLKGSTTGEKVPDEITEDLAKGYEYTTSQAPEDKIDYTIYELVETPENAEGIIEQDTEVTYYYQIKTADITFIKVAEEDHTEVLPGTEFALYALNDESSPEKDNLIDAENLASCWTLVNTYTSSASGRISLVDLPITTEYRLVETKASEDRLLPEGQWKIEFMYGNYDTSDSSIITVNDAKLKITKVGNPPALAIAEDGELELPNREIYDLPTSGSFGSKTIYQIGIAVMVIGGILLISRKILWVNKRNKYKKFRKKR